MSSSPKKKKSHYFHKGAPQTKRIRIEPHFKGFLCSCNVNEKACVKEAYNILNEYADKLYHSNAEKGEETHNKDESQDEEEEEDIQVSMEKELTALKSQKRFQSIDSGAKNIIFIKTSLQDPVKLATTIIEDIFATQQQKTRFLLRLVPVELICKVDKPEVIAKNFQPLIDKYFKDTPQTYSVIFNHRNNDNLKRDDVIKAIAQQVTDTKIDHKVDLKGAETSIVIEVIRGYVFISVIRNYLKYKKFNLMGASEAAKPDVEAITKNDCKPEIQ